MIGDFFVPMRAEATRVYLPDGAGGFDVRNCPRPGELAKILVRACNVHDQLVTALNALADTCELNGASVLALRPQIDQARAALLKANS